MNSSGPAAKAGCRIKNASAGFKGPPSKDSDSHPGRIQQTTQEGFRQTTQEGFQQATQEGVRQRCLVEAMFSKPQGKRAPVGPSGAWGIGVDESSASKR